MIKTYVRREEILQRTLQFWILQECGHSRCLAKPLILEEIKGDGEITQPTFSMEIKEAQFLMDKLWDCGLRPSEGSGSAGSLLATQKHLDDMRKLVFKHQGIK